MNIPANARPAYVFLNRRMYRVVTDDQQDRRNLHSHASAARLAAREVEGSVEEVVVNVVVVDGMTYTFATSTTPDEDDLDEDDDDDAVRDRALAKLSSRERRALGIDDEP